MGERDSALDLSVVIPALEESGSIGQVVGGIREAADRLGLRHEVLVADGGSKDATAERAREAGAEVLVVRSGFAESIRTGFRRSRGEYILVMDGDGSHPPQTFAEMWARRAEADVVVGSRLVEDGGMALPLHRRMLTKVLNGFFRRVLGIPVLDSSSGYRLYRAGSVAGLQGRSKHFEFQQETLLWVLRRGGTAIEVPIHYRWRESGRSKAKVLALGWGYVKTVLRFWRGLRA